MLKARVDTILQKEDQDEDQNEDWINCKIRKKTRSFGFYELFYDDLVINGDNIDNTSVLNCCF